MAPPKSAPRTANAGARYLRLSSTKVNQVAALIRNTHVDEARRVLAFIPKNASRELSKVLEAAIANAEHNHDLHADELYVKTVTADEGPTLKRFRPRAQGRAYKIRKRTSHINIVVERRVAESDTRSAADKAASSEKAARRWRRTAEGGEAAAAGGTKTKTGRTGPTEGSRKGPISRSGRGPLARSKKSPTSGKGGQRGS